MERCEYKLGYYGYHGLQWDKYMLVLIIKTWLPLFSQQPIATWGGNFPQMSLLLQGWQWTCILSELARRCSLPVQFWNCQGYHSIISLLDTIYTHMLHTEHHKLSVSCVCKSKVDDNKRCCNHSEIKLANINVCIILLSYLWYSLLFYQSNFFRLKSVS